MFGSRISHLGQLRCRARVSFTFPAERRAEPRDGADPPLHLTYPDSESSATLINRSANKKTPEGSLSNATRVRSDEER
jgi:hypothetical protein